jgi:branched-chain amino acid transport system ATP-binding protein
MLRLTGVSKRFGAIVVADAVDLELESGESLGIIGPNGAGKTSLLSLISGDLRVDSGSVAIDGNDVTRQPAARRAKLGIGRTYQVPRPFEGLTVFENALVAAQHGGRLHGVHAEHSALDALELTDLDNRANTLGADIALLDRKRLELARALASRPRLLLLDEIAAGLTEAEVDDLVATVQRVIASKVTVIWIEHVVRALSATVARLACLSGGRWIASGSCAEVLADPEVQRVYLGSPALDESERDAAPNPERDERRAL